MAKNYPVKIARVGNELWVQYEVLGENLPGKADFHYLFITEGGNNPSWKKVRDADAEDRKRIKNLHFIEGEMPREALVSFWKEGMDRFVSQRDEHCPKTHQFLGELSYDSLKDKFVVEVYGETWFGYPGATGAEYYEDHQTRKEEFDDLPDVLLHGRWDWR